MEGLVAQGLVKWFKSRKVVDSVSLDIQRGEVVGLLGPNGAGKTASFYMMVGRLRERGIGILITDHNVRETLAITDRAYILYDGKILVSGTATEIASHPVAREIYLGERFAL